ncbi:MAG: hypothetical protein JOZ48_05600 [Acidobacteriaceae bacterium]|nr:hypothetical protein [Acidobacteriaceae bacterium]
MPALEQLRRAVLRSADERETRLAYQQLFRAAADSDLGRLENDPDDGIALQAAWARRRLYPPESNHTLNRAFARGFLAVFEERFTIAPAWWKSSLSASRVYEDSRMSFSPGTASRQHRTRARLWVPAGVDADPLPEGGVLLRIAQRTVRVPSQPWNEAVSKARRSGGADQLSAVVQRLACFFAVYAVSSCNYYVSNIGSRDGRLAWRAESWAAGCARLGGQTYHYVQLLANARYAFTFGAAPNALYAEAFDQHSGQATVRFCTSLWSD